MYMQFPAALFTALIMANFFFSSGFLRLSCTTRNLKLNGRVEMATMFLQILNVPTTMLPLGARGSGTILITWNFGNMYMYIDT